MVVSLKLTHQKMIAYPQSLSTSDHRVSIADSQSTSTKWRPILQASTPASRHSPTAFAPPNRAPSDRLQTAAMNEIGRPKISILGIM